MRRARRKPRVPSAAVRRARSPKLPRGVELYYLLVLSKRADAFARACGRILTPSHVAKFAKPDPDVHTDAEKSDDVDATMRALRESTRGLDSDKFLVDTKTAAKRVVKHSQSEFDRLGIKMLDGEPDLSDMIDDWRKECVARITGMEDDQLDKIETLLKEGFGHRVETLQDEIERQIDGVTMSRAETIARSQVLSLNGKITKERHQAPSLDGQGSFDRVHGMARRASHSPRGFP